MATPNWFPEADPDWREWSVPAFPEGLTTAVSTVATLTQTVAGLLGLVKTTLEALSMAQLARVDLTQAAVTAAVSAINAALASLESDTGVYILMAPPRRRVIIPAVVQAAMGAVGISSLPPAKVNLAVVELETLAAKHTLDPAAAAFLHQASAATGGSAGFMRTVMDSLTDTGDVSRPQLANTDAVAGSVLLAGAPDYASLLNFLLVMDSLVGAGRPGSALCAPDYPTPQDLTVQKTAAGAQLRWRPQTVFVSLPVWDSKVMVTDVAVIRSTDPALLRARSPMEVFGTLKLTEGLTQGDAKVIKIRSNTSILSSYLDDTIPTGTTPYYYALSFRPTALEDNDQGYGTLSNTVKLVYGTTRSSGRGGASTPPDWVRLPRAIDLIPGMGKVFDWIRNTGKTFQNASLGADTSLKTYTEFLDQLITQYGGYVTTVNNTVQQLSALVNTPFTVGAGAYTFAGVGGNGFLVKSLAAGLSKLKFSETSFVGGVVIVVAGPSPAVIAPVWSIVEMLLGSASGGAEQSIFAKALKELNDQLNTVKALSLDPSFHPGVSAAPIVSTIPSEGCTPFDPAVPSIKDDFTV